MTRSFDIDKFNREKIPLNESDIKQYQKLKRVMNRKYDANSHKFSYFD